MAILILHGDHEVQSRNILKDNIDRVKKAGIKDIVRHNGETLLLENLKQAIESQSLFDSQRLVVIENLLNRPRSKTKEELLEYLEKSKPKPEVILWERKEVKSAVLKRFAKIASIKLFKISPKIFRFLDSLYPGNAKQMLSLYHETISKDKPELIFYMLCRRISALLKVQDSPLVLPNQLQPWQRQRLISQAKQFSVLKLAEIHHKLYRMDKSVKTGANILPLASMLDLLIANL